MTKKNGVEKSAPSECIANEAGWLKLYNTNWILKNCFYGFETDVKK